MTTLKLYVVVGLKTSSVFAFGDVDLLFAAVGVGNFDIDLDLGIGIAAV